MVRKGTFVPGDLAVYFEIDSKVPETEEFAFLANKHYKVKTQKYTFGGKGLMISQGLLMTFDDFRSADAAMPAWLIGFNCYLASVGRDKILEEGYFLTEAIGVKYSVAEDNKRKGSSDKYKKMAQRHWKLFKHNKLVQWLYARDWGKKLLFLFLGKKSDKKKTFWPE